MPQSEDEMAHKLDSIARAIRALTYAETEEVSKELRDMVKGRMEDGDTLHFDILETRDWMELLQDWAEYQLENK